MELPMLKSLVDYHYWANHRILDAVDRIPVEQYTRDLASSFPSIQATLAHLMYAEAVWLGRWTGQVIPVPKPEEIPTPADARTRWAALEEQVRSFIEGLTQADLERVHSFRISTGEEFRHPLWEMIHQVINHGTYHRGQVTAMLRQVGADATSTDLIRFYRERSGQL